jgi:hypothetical protein
VFSACVMYVCYRACRASWGLCVQLILVKIPKSRKSVPCDRPDTSGRMEGRSDRYGETNHCGSLANAPKIMIEKDQAEEVRYPWQQARPSY